MAEVDKAKAIECAEEIGKNIKTLAAGKSTFTLAEIVPKWDEMDNDMRLVVGLEFRDKVAKDNPDIVLEGQTEAGDDLYSLK